MERRAQAEGLMNAGEDQKSIPDYNMSNTMEFSECWTCVQTPSYFLILFYKIACIPQPILN